MSIEQARFMANGYASTDGLTPEEYKALVNWLMQAWGREVAEAFATTYNDRIHQELGQA